MRIMFFQCINRNRCRGVALLFLSAVPALTAHAASIAPADLISAIASYNVHETSGLPVPSDKDLQNLVDGRVVKIRERKKMHDSGGEQHDRIRIVGYRVIDRPRLLVWLAALDIGTQHSKRLTEHLMTVDESGGSRWYQYLRLPWPLKNRHWVVVTGKNVTLAAATNGAIWEHKWRLDDDGRATAMRLLSDRAVLGLDERDGQKAIYLPVNRGGWTMFELDEQRVLVAAHVASVLGGWIPDGLVARLASRQLDQILSALEYRSDDIHERYDDGYLIFAGDGRPITPDMAVAAHEATGPGSAEH